MDLLPPPYEKGSELVLFSTEAREQCWETGAVMTFFMIFTIVSFWGIIALLWCFKGFSREITQGRRLSRLVRVEQVSRVEFRAERKKVRPIEFERDTPGQIESQTAKSEEAKSGAHKLRAASVIAVAILLGSR